MTLLALLFIVFGLALPAGAIVMMDCLTYGHPPGLFKNAFWQWLRRLWS
jgi:hypothetical protein